MKRPTLEAHYLTFEGAKVTSTFAFSDGTQHSVTADYQKPKPRTVVQHGFIPPSEDCPWPMLYGTRIAPEEDK